MRMVITRKVTVMIACCNVNVLHVIMGAVVSLVLGSVWYAPFAFGGLAQSPAMPKKSIGECFVLEFLNSSMGVWALFTLLNFVEPQTLQDSLYIGLLVCFASAVPALLAGPIWKNSNLNDTLIGAAFSVTLVTSLIVLRSFLIA